MSTATTPYPLVLDPKAYAGIHLVESDGEPMETILHRDCMFLLIAAATYHNRGRPDFLVGGDNFIYFNPDQARKLDYRGPDFFYIKDGVDRSRQRQYWAVWEENGRLPDVVLELLSPTTVDEDRTTKFVIYEQILRTPEYFLYDPFTLLLEGYRLVAGTYQLLQPNERGWLWSEEMQAWLGHWEGEFLGTHATYLRLYTREGELVLLPDEDALQRLEQQSRMAEQERKRAERERQRAERERQRAERERQRADQERQRAEAAEQELAGLKALLVQRPVNPNPPSGNDP
jgi:Uma2 family endonuclease